MPFFSGQYFFDVTAPIINELEYYSDDEPMVILDTLSDWRFIKHVRAH